MTWMTAMLAGLATSVGAMDSDQQGPPPHAETHPPAVPAGANPVYPAEFYAAFQPQTALEMLERTPGFAISSGSEMRGFGGAAGNVLINGQRPTIKAGGIGETLRRIPASRVERIVLLRGSDAAEAQGQTLVANVILKADAKGAGNATISLARTNDGHISPNGQISYSKAIGSWQTSVELMAGTARYPGDHHFRNYDAAGNLVQSRLEDGLGKAPEYGFAASASGPLGGGTLTVNLRLNKDGYSGDSAIDIFSGEAVGTPDATRAIAYREDARSGELGVDWTRGLGSGWTTKLVGLARLESSETEEDYAEPGYHGVSHLQQKPAEFIARATLTREGARPVRPELGVELAYNRLSSLLDYAEDTGGGLVPVLLSNADTRVSELRGEAFANVTVSLATRLDLEAGAAMELSRIRVISDNADEQSLAYFKPSGALVWNPLDRTQVRLGYRRTVDQLDFGDFAASVDQADGRPIGGNTQLRPARVTRALLRLDHRWGKGGALALEAYHQWHKGLLGYLLLDSGDEALGTIGDARQWGVTAEATLPLSGLIPGAQLTLNGTLRASSFVDPLTGEVRDMDDLVPRSLWAEFRHDIPALRSSWGVSFEAAEEADLFYNGEILNSREEATWEAFVETTAIRGFKTTLKASAIGGADSRRLRRFYEPSRAGSLTGRELRNGHEGMVLTLTLSRQL